MAAQPHGVGQAITAIWISLAVSALSALAGKLMGLSTQDEFITSLIAYALLCIFPYKLGNGSNPTRYVYAVLTIMSFLFMAAGVVSANKIDMAVSVALLPVEVFIIYRLFQQEASMWFKRGA